MNFKQYKTIVSNLQVLREQKARLTQMQKDGFKISRSLMYNVNSRIESYNKELNHYRDTLVYEVA